MKNIALFFIGILVFIVIFGLLFGNNLEIQDPSGNESKITNTLWMWSGATTPVDSLELPDPENYTLTLLDDGVAQIKADCNNAQTTYEIDNGNISFGPIASTRAFCGEESLDNVFLSGLEITRIYFTENGNLFFDLQADSGTMEFIPGN